MDDCLSKPIEPRQLLDALDAAVSQVGRKAPEPTRESVTDIAVHPRFRPASGPAVDVAVLAKLEALGGLAFLDNLIDDFLSDASQLREDLVAACMREEVAEVLAKAHALFSAAGNMGAEPLRQVCREIENLTANEMARAGRLGLPELGAELERVAVALHQARRRGRPGVDGPAAGGTVSSIFRQDPIRTPQAR